MNVVSNEVVWKEWYELVWIVYTLMQTLQPPQKWKSEEKNLAVDDIVLLYEEQVPRSKWQVGRVIEVYPDAHGRVRQVQAKTKNTLLRRPVTKPCRIQLWSYRKQVLSCVVLKRLFVSYCC